MKFLSQNIVQELEWSFGLQNLPSHVEGGPGVNRQYKKIFFC